MNRKILSIVCLLSLALSACAFYPDPRKAKKVTNTNLRPNEDYPASKKVEGIYPLNHDVYTGYITVNDHSGSKLFYQLYSAIGKPITSYAPILIWLNGGPGSSSMFGNYGEMGPYDLVKEGGKVKPVPRNVTWNDVNHMIFIDSPVGTGFSVQMQDYYVANTSQAGLDLAKFLERFFEVSTYKNMKSYPLYIFGESYAGHYIPLFAHHVLRQAERTGIQLSGIGIGDGWTDPENQLAMYDVYTYAQGLAGENEAQEYKGLQAKAIHAIKSGRLSDGQKVFDSITEIIGARNAEISVYNIRQYPTGGDYEDLLTEFLNQPEIQSAFGVPSGFNYTSGNQVIYDNFSADIAESVAWTFEYLIPRLPIILFNGQDDLIVNTPGAWNWIMKLPANWFEGGQHIRDAEKQIWRLGAPESRFREIVGNVRVSGKFYFAVVNKAGHMVPTDQPDSGRDLVRRFMLLQKDWRGYYPGEQAVEAQVAQ